MRLLLIIPTTSYQIGQYLAAAKQLQIDLHLACDQSSIAHTLNPENNLRVDFNNPAHTVNKIVTHARKVKIDALLGIVELSCIIAAQASQILGLTHNPPDAVATAHNKFLFRKHLQNCGLPCPTHQLIKATDTDLSAHANVSYPCVLKPLNLSASRGVIRADDTASFMRAAQRIRTLLNNIPGQSSDILVEDFIPGDEFALEGLLENGQLQVLALFDKPDPLDGPIFEESIYVMPSRLERSQQQLLVDATAEVCTSLGLHSGPIHAELRLNTQGAWLIELATRSIGGRCSNTLEFGNNVTLEEAIFRNALQLPTRHLPLQPGASGVMMIPIPAAGPLRAVHGLDQARQQSGISAIQIDIAPGTTLVPLPEGDRYLGFIFARGSTPTQVEHNLRRAHKLLHFDID
jgi:biotin carboxylase